MEAARRSIPDHIEMPQVECSIAPVTSCRTEICPYAAHGICPNGENCPYQHGDKCDICGCAALSPFDEQQRIQHIQVNYIVITKISLLILVLECNVM